MTSEVFTRAFESWARYDPSRGTPAAWVCGIAHRVVVDRWRRLARRTEVIDEAALAAADADPGQGVETAERLAELRRALARLNERERDAIALRFAADLQHNEIAQILGSSTGAVKMTIFRALSKLRAALAQELPEAKDDEVMATSLEDAIGSVIARRRASLPDPLLARVVQLLAVIHRPEVPDRVRTRVEACIACDALQAPDDSNPVRIAGIALPSIARAFRVLTAPACVVCATAPALQLPLSALGLWGAATVLHAALVVLIPLNVALLWRRYQRHGRPGALVLAVVGAILITAHLAGHLFGLRMDPAQPTFWEMATGIWGGATLLAGAIYLDRRRPSALRLTPRTATS